MTDVLTLALMALVCELVAILRWRSPCPELGVTFAVLGAVFLCSAVGRALAMVFP